MTDPTQLQTIHQWMDYLDELLSDASVASGSEDISKMQDVQHKLRKFQELSPSTADQLDYTALRAIIKLDIQNVAIRIHALEELSEEYRRITKLIGAVTSDSKN